MIDINSIKPGDIVDIKMDACIRREWRNNAGYTCTQFDHYIPEGFMVLDPPLDELGERVRVSAIGDDYSRVQRLVVRPEDLSLRQQEPKP